MPNNYLVIFASHIDNLDKKKLALETLKFLKEESIDVCLVTHCKEYLSELSAYVKYIYYDYDNEYITLQDYSENIELLTDENCGKGKNKYDKPIANWLAGDGWYLLDYTKPEYSKSALSIIRNGNTIAYSHNYDWTIYLEWDIPVPIGGYKKLIEEKINLIKSQNTKCFTYTFDAYDIELKWPAIIIFDTKKLYESNILNNQWHLSKKDWIKYWGNTGFEYCINYMIDNIFINKISTQNIRFECDKLWGTSDYINLSKSYFLKEQNSNFIIKVCPAKVNDLYELYILVFSAVDNSETKIEDIKIYYDSKKVLSLHNLELSKNSWYLQKLPDILNTETIKLIYQINQKMAIKQETILSKSISKIYKYLLNLNFNS